MNASGRYCWFVSDIAITYGMKFSTLWPVSSRASVAHAVASYSHVFSPKHFDLMLSFIEPNAGSESVPSRTYIVGAFLFLYIRLAMNAWSHSIVNSSSKQSGATCSQKFDCARVRHEPAFLSIFLFAPMLIM